MKKNALRTGVALAGGFAALVLSQVAPPAPQRLNEFVPAGPLLYIEAKDFASLLSRWRASQENQGWLQSANYTAFAQSHLYMRLTDAYNEYAAAAGFAPDTAVLQSVAGSESALAIYDIGKVEFLYLTRLPSAKAVETAPWRSRSSFTPRNVAGSDFYVRTDQSSRVVAFAVKNDILLLATREDLIAGALQLMAREPRNKVIDEGWFAKPVRAAAAQGDLRLVMDFAALAKSPHFRSHWIQHNVSLVRQYSSGVSDLFLGLDAIREERLFFSVTPLSAESTPNLQPLAAALRLVPDDAGFYRGWVNPDAHHITELIVAKLLSPSAEPPERSPNRAPSAPNAAGTVGTEADLDTHIDEPPLPQTDDRLRPEALDQLLSADRLTAIVHIEETHLASDSVFIGSNRAVIVLRQTPWDASAVRESIISAVEGMWTTSRLGASWTEVNRGAIHYATLNGLLPLALAIDGDRLIVANSFALMERMLPRTTTPAPPVAAMFVARFQHERERHNFALWMRELDHARAPAVPGATTPPGFLSQNLVSLSDTLAGLRSASIRINQQGEAVRQTVVYELTP